MAQQGGAAVQPVATFKVGFGSSAGCIADLH